MAASQEQKVDYLLKKIGYVSSKTGIAEDSGLSGTKKAPFAEPIPSPLVTPSTSIWADSTLVPSTPPNSNTTYVGIYGSGNAFQMTYDNTVSGNRSFVARTTAGDQSSAISGDWIDPSFGADYAVVVYRGDPNSGGVSLPAAGTGSNDTWFFDYSSGVLNFNGTVVPTGITTNNVYLVGYRYTGAKGVLPPAGEAQFSTLEVTTGISTFGGDLDVNASVDISANLTVDGLSDLDELNVAGIATFASDLDVNANINSSGIITATTFSGTLENDLSLGVSGTGLSGSATYNNSSATTFTVTSNATSANTAETIVARDASGDFSAGTITASLTGTATTATNLADGANITTGTISDDRLPDLITSNINIASGISSVATLDATNATIDNLTFTSGTAITSVDTDLSSVSSSDDTLASAKAIKDYVDTQVTAQDLDFGGDSGTGSVDLDSQSFTVSGTANQIVTSGSGTTLTVGLTDSVTIADLLTADNITLVGTGNTATITGPDNIVIDPATVGDNTGTVIILGDLRVDGETTTINSTTLTIDDKSIVLASGAADSAAANGAGIEVDGASATFLYSHTGTKWVSNKNLQARSFIKDAGTSTEFLKADGSVDSNTYLTAESDTLDTVTTRGSTTTNNIGVGTITATKFVKDGGTASEFLKADGSVDSNTYLTSFTETQTLDDVTTLGNTTTNNIDVGEVIADGLTVTGISTLTNQAEVRSDDGSQGRIDFYCEVNNAHYTRVQAAAHSDYSGNATVTLPSSSGTLLLTDGDGSSLTNVDATTLDSIDSTSFLRSDAADIKTSGDLIFNDSIQAAFGNNSDLLITHDGIDNHIRGVDKDLNIELAPDGSNPKIYIRPTTSTQGITLGGGSGNPVELYHNNVKELYTVSGGIVVNSQLIIGPSQITLDSNGYVNIAGIVTAGSFVKSGGAATEFLKADGSVDTNTYLTSYTETQTLDDVTTLGNTTTNNIGVGTITATKFVKDGGTSTEFLKADGSVDSNTYLTSFSETDTLDSVTTRGSTTTNNIDVGEVIADGLNVTGISTLTNKAEIRSDDSTPGRIDFFCESNNAHYTRIQAAQHSEYSGNVTVTLPTIDGDVIVGDTASAITQNVNTSGIITAASFVKASNSGGFLKADGTEDTNTYLTSATLTETDTLDSVTTRGSTTTNNIGVGTITATEFVKDGGASTEFLKADGSVDTNTYLTSFTETQTLDDVTTLGNTTTNTITVGKLSVVGTGNTGIIDSTNSDIIINPLSGSSAEKGRVIIQGNLQVDGTTTEINSTTLTIDDKSIVVASGATDSASANDAGIEVDGANATFQYSHIGTKWVSNKDLQAEAFIKNGGSSTEFLKADGSVDTNTYLTSFSETDTLDSVTTRGSTTTNNIGVGTITATEFVKSGGQSTEFLKADGSVDSSTYLTSFSETDTLDSVTTRGSTTTNNIGVGTITATEFVKSGGTASEFLKADGSVDSNTYLTSFSESDTLDTVTTRGSTTTNNIGVGTITATEFVKSGGQSTEFLKADGSVDTNTYLTSFSESDTLDSVTTRGSTTTNNIGVGTITATEFVKDGGTSTEFLKADGSVDSNTYLTSFSETDTLDTVTTRGSTTTNNVGVGTITATEFVKSGGAATEFLKADGSVDSNTYLTSFSETDTLDTVTTRGSTTTNNVGVGTITATEFVKSGGQSTEFLKADGSVDSSTYLTSFTETQTLDDVTTLGNATTNSVAIGTATSPSVQLEVVGDAKVTGILTVGQASVTINGTDNSIHGYDVLIAPPKKNSTVELTVTVATKSNEHRYYNQQSANGYRINGVEAPFLTLTPGRTYKFDQSDTSNSSHPLRFYREASNTATLYETNVTYGSASPGQSGAYTQIVVTDDTPTVLHYQCSSHLLMGNSLQSNSISSSVVGVSSGTYGDGRYVPQITVNTEGKITSISAVEIFNNGLGSDLDLNNNNITGTGGVNITGIVTATSFQGDAANMTGLTGVGAGTYGSANTIPVVTVATDGRIESISTVLASGGGGGGGGSSAVTRTVTSFTATAGQTTFNVSYTAGTIDVFVNGSRLSAAEFTATNGSSVVLTTGASVGDIVDVAAYASSLGIELQNNGAAVGTATTINFSTDLNVSMNGNTATVTSTASGGSGGGVSEELAIAYSIAL